MRAIKPIAGQRYGKLTTTGRVESRKQILYWEVVCDCSPNEVKFVWGGSLRAGHTKSCGCGSRGRDRSSPCPVGARFGKLVTTGQFELRANNAYWEVVCDCSPGITKFVKGSSLRGGYTNSCGCLLKEYLPDTARSNMLTSYRNNATRRGIEFDLTKDEFFNIASGDCHLCSKQPELRSFTRSGHGCVLNGVDRVDNSKGYTVDNCKPCCSVCNLIKKDMTMLDLKEHITSMYRRIFLTDTLQTTIGI